MSDENSIREPAVAYATRTTSTIIKPFIQRGIFTNQEGAIAEMARTYIVGQIQEYQQTIDTLQSRYGMSYEQFETYLQLRADELMRRPTKALNQAIMHEEDDSLDWKVAREMQASWLGLRIEAGL